MTAALPGGEERSDEPCRGPEPLRPAERAPKWAGIPDEAGAERSEGAWGRAKGVNPGEAGRGGKGAASGGGTERRSLLSEPSGRSARCRQSREAKPTASADSRAKRERSCSAASRARRAGEVRGAQATRNASPSTGESRPRALRRQRARRQSAAFWPSGDNQASCRRRAGAPGGQATKRSGADARGGLPPFFYCCAGRGLLKTREKGGLARFLRRRSRRRLKRAGRRVFSRRRDAPKGQGGKQEA